MVRRTPWSTMPCTRVPYTAAVRSLGGAYPEVRARARRARGSAAGHRRRGGHVLAAELPRHDALAERPGGARAERRRRRARVGGALVRTVADLRRDSGKIGRASCWERVCRYV